MLSVVNYKDVALEQNHAEVIYVSDEKETIKKALNKMEAELENFKLMKLKAKNQSVQSCQRDYFLHPTCIEQLTPPEAITSNQQRIKSGN
jgi:hypothetical protein